MPVNSLRELDDPQPAYDQINRASGLRHRHVARRHEGAGSGTSGNDSVFTNEQQKLGQLADDRDAAATTIKQMLSDAAAGKKPKHGQLADALAEVSDLLDRAHTLATSP